MEGQKSGRKTRVGTVISDKMDKTVVVMVERLVHHSKYHKFIRRQNKFRAHDAQDACKVGDRVLIEESRPLSRTKRWVVVETLDKAVT
jgi:small subunit ribosomal protein S17